VCVCVCLRVHVREQRGVPTKSVVFSPIFFSQVSKYISKPELCSSVSSRSDEQIEWARGGVLTKSRFRVVDS